MSNGTKDYPPNPDIQKVSKDARQMSEGLLSKLKKGFIIVWLVAKTTLTVVIMALLALSPALVWPLLMAWPVPHCYVAFVIWIAYLVTVIILASVVAYLRETKKL